MEMKKTALATAIVSLLSHAYTSPVFAQNTTTETDETMVVTANRFEQSQDSILTPVEVITKDDIQSIQAKSLDEVLRRLPGVQIATTGGYGQQTSVFIRGAESDHTLILINGVRVSSATTGSTAVGSIPLNGIERIEYIRGPRTALYGSDAMGGVINIITSFSGNESEIWVEAGSHNYQKYAASTAHEVGDKSWVKVSVNQEKTDGFSATNSTYPWYSPGDEDDDGYDHTDLMLEVGHGFTDELSLKINANYTNGSLEYDQGEKEQVLFSSSAVGAYKTTDLTSELILAISRDQSSYVGSDSNYETNSYSFAWQNSYKISQNLLFLGGVDWINDDVSESTTEYSETSRSNLGLYTTGIFTYNKLQTEVSTRLDDNEQYGSHITWQAASGYQLTSIYRVSANIGTAFKAPTFNDLYYPGNKWGDSANPNLTPEESLNFEVALDIKPVFMDLRLAFYENQISDLIAKSSITNKYENINEARIQGIEISGSFNTGDFYHSASIDIMDAINEDTGNELARRAKLSGKWNTSYQLNDWEFNLSYLYSGDSYDDAANTVQLDSYSLFDFATKYYITDNLTVHGKIANLFDAEYETAYGYNTLERSYYLGANYKF
jgi:vitamin B12 transporter